MKKIIYFLLLLMFASYTARGQSDKQPTDATNPLSNILIWKNQNDTTSRELYTSLGYSGGIPRFERIPRYHDLQFKFLAKMDSTANSGYVTHGYLNRYGIPYTGATTDVDLNGKSLTGNFINGGNIISTGVLRGDYLEMIMPGGRLQIAHDDVGFPNQVEIRNTAGGNNGFKLKADGSVYIGFVAEIPGINGINVVGKNIYDSDGIQFLKTGGAPTPAKFDTLKYGPKIDFKYPSDYTFRPFGIYEKGGKYFADKSNYDILANKIKSMKPYFVDYENGSNANSGLSPSNAVKTANYAFVTLGARLIYLAPGVYKSDWFNNISNAAGDDLVIIGAGQGRTYLTSADANTHTWTNVAGAMYSTPLANADRVVDNNYTGEKGYPLSLKMMASQSLCQSTANSMYTDNVNVYVHLTDGRAPGDEVLLLLNGIANNVFYKADAGYIYFSDATFMGGGNNVLLQRRTSGVSTLWSLAQRCSFLFSSGEGYKPNGIGGSWIEDCTAFKNVRDGFNYKDPNGNTKGVIEINCESSHNGGYPDTTSSVNGSSAHDGINTIRINGKYYSNVGPNIIDVEGASAIVAGCQAYDSKGFTSPFHAAVYYPQYGDYAVGGATAGAKMWVLGSNSQDTRYSFATDTLSSLIVDSSSVYKAGFKLNVTRADYTTGMPVAKFSFPVTSTFVASTSVTSATAPLSITGGNIAITSPLPGANGGTGVANSGKTITLAGNLNLFDANNVTLRSGGSTNVTLPTSGTIYSTATGSITSAQLFTSVTNETGTGVVVGSDSPVFTTKISAPHIIGSSATPTIVAGTGAGTTPTVSITGTDLAGEITITTGTSPTSAATIATITFSTAYGSAPYITLQKSAIVTPSDLELGTRSTTSFTISGTLAASTTYKYNYIIVQ